MPKKFAVPILPYQICNENFALFHFEVKICLIFSFSERNDFERADA